MVKLNLSTKQFLIYWVIVILTSGIFIGLSWFLVDKTKMTTAFIYSLIALPIVGAVRYILLLEFWRKGRK